MKPGDLITVADLLEFEKRIVCKLTESIRSLKELQNSDRQNYLRSKDARELLKVSENKLRSMRDNGEIPFSFIGGTYYYPEHEILDILKSNTINHKNK